MDRITRVRIANVRSIEYVDLEISPLTVLIGENGSGKSTIIEVLELLRKAAEPSFLQQFYAVHRGLAGLLRKGATSLTLGVVIEDEARANARLEYSFELAARTNWAEIAREHLVVGGVGEEGTASVVVDRVASRVEVFSSKEGRLVPSPPQVVPVDQLAITTFGSHPPHAAITRLLTVLGGIEVHLPFDTLASWVARSYQFGQSLRGSTTYLLQTG
jgi:energy-coupling factor transporter ATP-binding protein EcfA2